MRTCVIYIIGVTDNPVKIGFAVNVKKRLSSLQIGCADPLVVHHSVAVPSRLAQEIEHATHKELESKHRLGEWFDVPAHEALEVVLRQAKRIAGERAIYDPHRGDPLEAMIERHGLDVGVREAVNFYRTRQSMSYHARKITQKADIFVLKRVGDQAYTVFRMVVAEQANLDTAFWTKDPKMKAKAEGMLASALNALADFYSYLREEKLAQDIAAA